MAAAILLCAAYFTVRPALLYYHLHQARALLRARDADAALVHLGAAERLAPRRADIHFLSARAFRRQGDFDSMHQRLRRARELGFAIQRLQKEQWLAQAQTGTLSRAETVLRSLLVDPGDDGPEICEAFVNGDFLLYRTDRALPLLAAWRAEYPDDPLPFAFQGMLAEEGGRWEDAQQAYHEALRRGLNRMDVRIRLGYILIEQRRLDEAREHFLDCLRLAPDAAEAFAGLGRCLLLMNRDEESREAYQRTLALEPSHFDARLGLGELELNAGRVREALRWLEPAHAERPHRRDARFALARALQADGQSDVAAAHFEFVTQSHQAMIEVQKLTDHLQYHPHDAEVRFQVAQLLQKYDDPAQAAFWLRSVLDLQPNHAAARDALAAQHTDRADLGAPPELPGLSSQSAGR